MPLHPTDIVSYRLFWPRGRFSQHLKKELTLGICHFALKQSKIALNVKFWLLGLFKPSCWHSAGVAGGGSVAVVVSINNIRQVTANMWHVTHDMWYRTLDMWHVTHDMWHVTYDTWHLTQVQNLDYHTNIISWHKLFLIVKIANHHTKWLTSSESCDETIILSMNFGIIILK